MNRVSRVLRCRNHLGEGPAWDTRTQTLYWADIALGILHSFHPQTSTHKSIPTPETKPTSVMLTTNPTTLLLSTELTLSLFNLETSQKTNLCTLVENDSYRLNDAKVTPNGEIFAGTMSKNRPRTVGGATLFRVTKTLEVSKIIENVTVSNGMDWSPNMEIFYYIDSPTKQITKYSYDHKNGEIHDKEALFSFQDLPGAPDGMCADVDGNLWVAFFRGSRVVCLDPVNKCILQEVEIPCKCVTSLCFGGKDLDVLYITTAMGSSEEEISDCQEPEAGNLFELKVNTRGREPFLFKIE